MRSLLLTPVIAAEAVTDAIDSTGVDSHYSGWSFKAQASYTDSDAASVTFTWHQPAAEADPSVTSTGGRLTQAPKYRIQYAFANDLGSSSIADFCKNNSKWTNIEQTGIWRNIVNPDGNVTRSGNLFQSSKAEGDIKTTFESARLTPSYFRLVLVADERLVSFPGHGEFAKSNTPYPLSCTSQPMAPQNTNSQSTSDGNQYRIRAFLDRDDDQISQPVDYGATGDLPNEIKGAIIKVTKKDGSVYNVPGLKPTPAQIKVLYADIPQTDSFTITVTYNGAVATQSFTNEKDQYVAVDFKTGSKTGKISAQDLTTTGINSTAEDDKENCFSHYLFNFTNIANGKNFSLSRFLLCEMGKTVENITTIIANLILYVPI